MLDNKEKWNRCLEFICNNVGEKPFSTWFGPIVFEGIKNKQAVLRVPTNFFLRIYRRALHKDSPFCHTA